MFYPSRKQIVDAGYKQFLFPSTNDWKSKKAFTGKFFVNPDVVFTGQKGIAITSTGGYTALGGSETGGFLLAGSITCGKGDDKFASQASTISISNGATINLGKGNNSFSATDYKDTQGNGIVGIQVGGDGASALLSGAGRDIVSSKGYGNAISIYSGSSVSLGGGNDTIEGSSYDENIGIHLDSSTIDTGEGNDMIIGIANNGRGIYMNNGLIDAGAGDDTVTGNLWINSGNLRMGDGNDKVYALNTISGYSYVNGLLDFGGGSDSIFLPKSTYKIELIANGQYSIGSLGANGYATINQAHSDSSFFIVANLEKIWCQETGASFEFAAGVVTF